MSVTLTNKTNRHVEIEGLDGVSTIINSGAVSEPLEESNFTSRTKRLIKQGYLFQTAVETIKESTASASEATAEQGAEQESAPASNKSKRTTSKKVK